MDKSVRDLFNQLHVGLAFNLPVKFPKTVESGMKSEDFRFYSHCNLGTNNGQILVSALLVLVRVLVSVLLVLVSALLVLVNALLAIVSALLVVVSALPECLANAC